MAVYYLCDGARVCFVCSTCKVRVDCGGQVIESVECLLWKKRCGRGVNMTPLPETRLGLLPGRGLLKASENILKHVQSYTIIIRRVRSASCNITITYTSIKFGMLKISGTFVAACLSSLLVLLAVCEKMFTCFTGFTTGSWLSSWQATTM